VLFDRRKFLGAVSAFGVETALRSLAPAYAQMRHDAGLTRVQPGPKEVNLVIREQWIPIAEGRGKAVTVNGTVPGPILRFHEGDEVTIHVKNEMPVTASIHWHGILLPFDMDGVPAVSFPGIRAGETFTYRYKLRQSGTYWYHSHSGFQEQSGLYGPSLIDPAQREPYQYEREYVVLFSDWTFEDPDRVIAKIKKLPSYYNFQQRTIGDFFRDSSRRGLGAALRDRLMWGRMRMNPTDILDVTGYTYTHLVNGLSPAGNWTGVFDKGERVRLRFINSGAMTIFDVRIPGMDMTVVQADGIDVHPVTVHELRIGAAETYDVIVQPHEEKAYTIFAETMDRSGYAAATLAPRPGMRGPIPARRKRPLRTMADMGMAHNGSMGGHESLKGHDMGGSQRKSAEAPQAPVGHEAHGQGAAPKPPTEAAAGHAGHATEQKRTMPGTQHAGHATPTTSMPETPGYKKETVMHGPDHHGPGNAMIAEMPSGRLNEPGTGLEETDWKVLVYTDLHKLEPDANLRPPQYEIELHLTGNMERNMWSINGKKFSEDPAPIPLRFGEKTRFTLVNDTMMDHPMHIHGMFMVLENGSGAYNPYKHTILVKAGERLSFYVTPDEKGPFVFHCHLLFHMELGMFRIFRVTETEDAK
jgi:CopA family copper-resistance protein